MNRGKEANAPPLGPCASERDHTSILDDGSVITQDVAQPYGTYLVYFYRVIRPSFEGELFVCAYFGPPYMHCVACCSASSLSRIPRRVASPRLLLRQRLIPNCSGAR